MDNDKPMASKVVLLVAFLLLLLFISCFVFLYLKNIELIDRIRFCVNSGLVVEAVSLTNQDHYLKMPFYLECEKIKKLFNLEYQWEIRLRDLKDQLLIQINNLDDQQWKCFSVLDDPSNHLKLYYRYCKEILNNSGNFVDTGTTIDMASDFIKKFESIEYTQQEFNKITQLFFYTAILTIFAVISIVIMMIAIIKICNYKTDLNFENKTQPSNHLHNTKCEKEFICQEI